MTLYHITTQAEWQAAQDSDEYTAPSLESQGFIHLSATGDQVERVANAIYAGQSDLIVLCIDPDALAATVKTEPPDTSVPAEHYEGELFPHLYGALNVDAVIEVRPLIAGQDGRYDFPIR